MHRFTTPVLLLLAAAAPAAAEPAGPVAVEPFDCAYGTVAVSVLGCAHGVVAVSARGAAVTEGDVGVAVSGFGPAQGGCYGVAASALWGASNRCQSAGPYVLVVSGARDASSSGHAVSGAGDASAGYGAVSGGGDATGGTAAVSGTGHAGRQIGVSGTCAAQGSALAASPGGGVVVLAGVDGGVTVLGPVPGSWCA